jgi:hypothetical protein
MFSRFINFGFKNGAIKGGTRLIGCTNNPTATTIDANYSSVLEEQNNFLVEKVYKLEDEDNSYEGN